MEDLRHRHSGGTGAGDDDLEVGDVLADDPCGVHQGREDDDRRPVLVIVHDGDVERGLDPVLDLEAPRRGDVFEVDRPEGRGDPHDRVDDLVDVVAVDDDGDRVEPGEALEQGALALHHRQGRARADVAEAEHGRSVGDHRDEPPGPGQLLRAFGLLGDRRADAGDSRGVGDREVALGLERPGEFDCELAVVVSGEDLVFGDSSGRSLSLSSAVGVVIVDPRHRWGQLAAAAVVVVIVAQPDRSCGRVLLWSPEG